MPQFDSTAHTPIGYADEEINEFGPFPTEELPPNIEIEEDGGVIVDFSNEPEEELPLNVPFDDNLADYIDENELKTLSSELVRAYEDDVTSRKEWLDTFKNGLDLLGANSEDRTDPFPGASGVYHPLLSEAATQFQAQAYKELLPAGGPVSVDIVGEAENKEAESLMERGNRVMEFMNYQITHVMEEYDPELDQMLFYLPLSGSAFKKVYYDAPKGRAVSKFVTAEDLVVDYYATDLASAARVTHVFRLSENDLLRHQLNGFYREVEIKSQGNTTEENGIREKVDEMHGVSKPGVSEGELTCLEMHTELDLAGFEDSSGLAIPYVVTICKDTGDILAIRRNYNENDERFVKKNYFVHYKFLPGLGFYGIGLIHAIGGLARSSTSLLRQLIDSGTFSNLPGGLKARGLKVDKDKDPISPGEFRDVDVPGGNIRDSIMTLPYKEPSVVLQQLLGVLVESGRRFAATSDMAVSDSGSQQNPVGTTLALLERGSRAMSAIHKRLHYAQKKEFVLMSDVFASYLPPEYPYSVGGVPKTVKQQDFGPEVDVMPVSDPNIFSMTQRIMLAQQQLQMAQSAPEVYNLKEAHRRMHVAIGTKDIDTLLPPDPKPMPKSPAQEHAGVMINEKLQAFPQQNHDAHIEAHIIFLQNPIVQQNPDYYTNLVQDIMNHIGHKAQAMAEQQIQQAMVSGKIQEQQVQQVLLTMKDSIEAQMMQQISQKMTPPQQEDPMTKMHQLEMQIKQRIEEEKANIQKQKLDLDRQKTILAEETKRLGIDAKQQSDNEKVAQQREAEYLRSDTEDVKAYSNLVKEAAKNDMELEKVAMQGEMKMAENAMNNAIGQMSIITGHVND
jgi:hypothetical protein